MLILGIETSGRTGSLALCRDGHSLDERLMTSQGRRHAQGIAIEIDSLLRQFDLTAHDCDGVAVSIGPGSFTGLRVGVVFAKTFSYATGCALAAVETLHAVAELSPPNATAVWVVSEAQRGDLYVGRYVRSAEGPFVRAGEIQIVDASTWCANRSDDEIVSGPGVERYEAQLAGRCQILQPAYRHPTAVVVAELGSRRLAEQPGDDLWSLEPLYIRHSAAEERRAAEEKQAEAEKSANQPPGAMD